MGRLGGRELTGTGGFLVGAAGEIRGLPPSGGFFSEPKGEGVDGGGRGREAAGWEAPNNPAILDCLSFIDTPPASAEESLIQN